MHSAKLISLADARQDRDISVEAAWDAYIAARAVADETLKLEDGIAAAKAFKRFLELFVGRL